MSQRRPEEAGELAGNGRDDVLFRFASCGQAPVASVQPMLRMSGLVDDGRGRAALPHAKGAPEKRMMPVVPRGFDEHTAQVGVARLCDAPARLFRPAGILRGDEPGKGHHARRGRTAPTP